MRIVLTNDDGIDAPGLRAIEAVLSARDDVELWVVAPESQRSACSHGMTLRSPVRFARRGPRTFVHDGLVADGVYFALVHLLDDPPDLVVSGINAGANLGEDVIYSGTVAGAREAALRRVRGMAVSLASGDDFAPAARATSRLIDALVAHPDAPLLVNVNFPAGCEAMPVLAPLGHRTYVPRVEQVAPEVYLLGGPAVKGPDEDGNTDVGLVRRGTPSMTVLAVDQSAQRVPTAFADRFAQKG